MSRALELCSPQLVRLDTAALLGAGEKLSIQPSLLIYNNMEFLLFVQGICTQYL